MIQGRFGLFDEDEIKRDMIVYADYQVPRVLRHFGVLKYDKDLARRVDNFEIIPKNSEDEIEIRASTVVAGKMIEDEIEKYCKVNPASLDYALCKESRSEEFKKQLNHIT